MKRDVAAACDAHGRTATATRPHLLYEDTSNAGAAASTRFAWALDGLDESNRSADLVRTGSVEVRQMGRQLARWDRHHKPTAAEESDCRPYRSLW